MSYSTSKQLPKARGDAMKLLFLEQKSINWISAHTGYHRTTIWRWKKKWEKQNSHIQLRNENRRKDAPTSSFRYASCKWNIPTQPATPLNPHCLPDDLVQLVLDVRDQQKRCAEVVWHYINGVMGIQVSLSSVRRILRRHGRLEKRKKKSNYKAKRIPRPDALFAGALVETDTIHLTNPISGTKKYIYTVIDTYSRMTYAEIHDEIRPGHSADVIFNAQRYMQVPFKVVQADNGSEFSSYFEHRLHSAGITVRHTRLHRPNDNAHIERFNRTLQEECTGSYMIRSVSTPVYQGRIRKYLDYYNYKRIHLGIQGKVPASMLQRF